LTNGVNKAKKQTNKKPKIKNMKTQIEIMHFPTRTLDVRTFPTEKMAQQHFREFADFHNLDIDGDMAGGIGFDYRVTLCEID
jgi:hypothetical protein